MQQIAPPPVAQQQPQANPVGSAIGTANMVNGLYKAGQKAAAPKVAPTAGKTTSTAAPTGAAGAAPSTTPAATTAGGGAAAETVAADAAAKTAGDAATTAATEKLGEAAATKATEAAATEIGKNAALNAATPATGSLLSSGAGAALGAVGTALPWVGAAYAVGNLLELWNRGGEVGTQNQGVSEDEAVSRFADAERRGDIKDIRAGGKVPGEWQGNTDNVPALLTEDEHVVNAEAAAMIGHDKLEAWNKKGLAMRAKGYTPGRIRAGLGLMKEAV